MKVLLITTSARGHAIADALMRSPQKPSVICISPSANPGIRRLVGKQIVMDVMDFDTIIKIAKEEKPNFAFIGPEDPIGSGLVDRLQKECDVPSVAPMKSGARIESSKAFTRDLCTKYVIDVSPSYATFAKKDPKAMRSFIQDDCGGEYVVKYDALKGGKGVKLSGEHLPSIDDGIAYAEECVDECGSVVIEEKLVGPEFSLLSFASGLVTVDMPAVQDHKRAYKGDTGPNTGGMGTYSDANHSLPFLQQSDIDRASEINAQVAKALMEECGEPYKGILYGGFIATKKGVQLIEYNCRFGDPEVLNILPLLQSDFVDICKSIIDGSLSSDLVVFENKATVCNYITPEGYPENKNQRGETVIFPEIPENARIFYGDISEDSDGSLKLGGSRTAGIVGIGDSIAEAQEIAVSLCEKVQGHVRFREDIGTEELIKRRIDQICTIRGVKYF